MKISIMMHCMKLLLFFSIPILSLLAACSVFQKRSIEVSEEPNVKGYVTIPNKNLAQRSGNSLKDLHIGFGVYLRSCGECHTHALPDELSTKDWHVVTPRMAWNANITDAEQDALLKYLLAARSDPAQPAEQPEIRFKLATPKS
jgi:hypothetical protein